MSPNLLGSKTCKDCRLANRTILVFCFFASLVWDFSTDHFATIDAARVLFCCFLLFFLCFPMPTPVEEV